MRLPTVGDISSSANLAAAFGWSNHEMFTRKVHRGGTGLDISNGFLAGQSAALFATVDAVDKIDPIDAAALYAYHSSADWGVVADRAGLTVFNSHWLKDAEWYRIPKIGWHEVANNVDILSGLSPSALINRDLQRVASKMQQPTDFLRPVDDALVERLDRWRDEALRYASSSLRVDDLLQTFYAQLFVLRTVEDRKLDAAVPQVRSVVTGSDRIDRVQWSALFEVAKKNIGSDLFSSDVTESIPDHVLAGVILDLYRPRNVPGADAQYDFSWIAADVLGLAYEKYLGTILHPIAPPTQVDMFLTPERGVERLTVRKSAGAYYTPKYITDYLSTVCVTKYFAEGNQSALPYIIDFSCGSGSFLVAAVDKVLKHLKSVDPNRPWAKELIKGGHIAGIDIDAKAVTAARLHLWQRLIEEPGALPLPNLSQVVLAADGLDRASWGHLDRQYDIVLGNPPFMATSMVLGRERLEANFETAKGRYDFSSLFVEQALNVLKPHGRLGLVVPNRLFKSRSGGHIRQHLTNRANLLMIVDFGTTRPFDADAYVACILAETKRKGEGTPQKVDVMEVKSLDADFLASVLLSAKPGGPEAHVVRYFQSRHPHSESPWSFLSASEEMSRVMIEEVSVRLDTIAGIPQGIRTGANDLFFFEVLSEDGSGLTKVVNGLGEEAIIEADLLEPALYGSQVGRYQRLLPTSKLMYPYRDGTALSEGELDRFYPYAWSYFQRNRDLLAARGSLKKSNGRFYELIWPRDEKWLRQPKLLIRDLAPQTAFAIDPNGSVFLVGGTAVVPDNPELLYALMAYLNSDVINALVTQITPQFRGNFQKFEPQHIQGIPVLDRLLEDEMLQANLTEMAKTVVEQKQIGQNPAETELRINALIAAIAQERGIGLLN